MAAGLLFLSKSFEGFKGLVERLFEFFGARFFGGELFEILKLFAEFGGCFAAFFGGFCVEHGLHVILGFFEFLLQIIGISILKIAEPFVHFSGLFTGLHFETGFGQHFTNAFTGNAVPELVQRLLLFAEHFRVWAFFRRLHFAKCGEHFFGLFVDFLGALFSLLQFAGDLLFAPANAFDRLPESFFFAVDPGGGFHTTKGIEGGDEP